MKEFYCSEEYKDSPVFMNYLENLKTPKPFDCEYLRVLPEQVWVFRNGKPSGKYNQGELICLKKIETTSRRCGVESRMRNGLNGEFEVRCSAGEKQLIIKIERAEELELERGHGKNKRF